MPREIELGAIENSRSVFSKTYSPIRMGNIRNKPFFHDKALIKAQNAHYAPSKDSQIKSNPFKTLFVARLDIETTENDLKRFFKRFGEIKSLRLIKDIKTNESKGYAFIEFRHSAAFKKAYQKSNGAYINGTKILVDFERERIMKGWKPRRLGGGLGGNIKSGQMRFGCRSYPFRRNRKRPLKSFV